MIYLPVALLYTVSYRCFPLSPWTCFRVTARGQAPLLIWCSINTGACPRVSITGRKIYRFCMFSTLSPRSTTQSYWTNNLSPWTCFRVSCLKRRGCWNKFSIIGSITTPLAEASTPPQEWNSSPLWRGGICGSKCRGGSKKNCRSVA